MLRRHRSNGLRRLRYGSIGNRLDSHHGIRSDFKIISVSGDSSWHEIKSDPVTHDLAPNAVHLKPILQSHMLSGLCRRA